MELWSPFWSSLPITKYGRDIGSNSETAQGARLRVRRQQSRGAYGTYLDQTKRVSVSVFCKRTVLLDFPFGLDFRRKMRENKCLLLSTASRRLALSSVSKFGDRSFRGACERCLEKQSDCGVKTFLLVLEGTMRKRKVVHSEHNLEQKTRRGAPLQTLEPAVERSL